MNITVYCGVALGNNPAFEQAAKDFGSWIGEAGHTLVYGGGGLGMMGTLSNAVLDAGGRVLGIIPQFLVDKEQLNPRLEDPIVVDTMAERKLLLRDYGDAYVMLPGGIGTFEEITEILSGVKLGFVDNGIFIANIEGCYDHFISALNSLVELEFLEPYYLRATTVGSIQALAEELGEYAHTLKKRPW